MMQSASDTFGSAKDRVSGGVTSMREKAGDMTNTAREQWERARGGMDHLVNEQPLALGAIGLAIGAILGAAAPRTRMEEQTLGQASRNLAEKAKEMGSQQLDKATQSAKQMAEEKPGQGKQQSPDKKAAW